MTLEHPHEAALRQVADPCSLWNQTNLNIVEMGLVREVRVVNRVAHVQLSLTDPSCVFFFEISEGIRQALVDTGDVDSVEVDSISDDIWTEDRIEPEARSRLAAQRRLRLLVHAKEGTTTQSCTKPLQVVARPRGVGEGGS